MLFLFFSEKDLSKCNIKTHKRNMKFIFANYFEKYAQINANNWKCYRKFLGLTWKHWIKQLDKALFQTTFRKKLSRKSGKHMFEKRCFKNLHSEKDINSKIHSEDINSKIHSLSTSKMEIFAKKINYQKSLTIFVKSSSLDVW